MALRRLGNVTVLTRTTAFGYYHQNFVGAVEQLTDHLAPAGQGCARAAVAHPRGRSGAGARRDRASAGVRWQ
jgi:hypothetical protein